MVHSVAPTLSATRAQSTATLPPPTTSTRLPLTPASFFQLPALRNSSAPMTPSASDPGIGMMRLSCRPVAISTASYSPMRWSMGTSSPMAVLSRRSMPMVTRSSTSCLMMSRGSRYAGTPENSAPPGWWSFSYTVTAVAQPHQVVGRGQAARPAADDRDGLLARLGQRLHALLANLRVALVGHTVERPDRDRLVVVVALARRLARVVADPAEHTGHDVAVAHQLVGLGHAGPRRGGTPARARRRSPGSCRRTAAGGRSGTATSMSALYSGGADAIAGMSSRPRMPVRRRAPRQRGESVSFSAG